jgi:hypothetical protein
MRCVCVCVHASNDTGASRQHTEYVPTTALQFMETLLRHFPRHALLLTDFDRLPEAMPGINGPVVRAIVRPPLACGTHPCPRACRCPADETGASTTHPT